MSEWVIPCNPKQYDIIGAFSEFDRIEWKQANHFEIGDHIYIYVSGKGHGKIEYLCVVNRMNIPTRDMKDEKYIIDGNGFVNFGRYIELVKIEKLDTHLLTHYELSQNGLKGNLQGPMRISDPVLSSYIYASTTTRLSQKPNRGPDSDHTLKEIISILLRAYNCAVPRKYLSDIIYPIGRDASGSMSAPIQELVTEGKIIRHEDNTLQTADKKSPDYFLVFQSKNYEKEPTLIHSHSSNSASQNIRKYVRISSCIISQRVLRHCYRKQTSVRFYRGPFIFTAIEMSIK